jgi:hypothetical protein
MDISPSATPTTKPLARKIDEVTHAVRTERAVEPVVRGYTGIAMPPDPGIAKAIKPSGRLLLAEMLRGPRAFPVVALRRPRECEPSSGSPAGDGHEINSG